ncbi:recombinase family protein [Neobacillus sp. NPDC097160]|uniref:recombinase family protein n=1 Tax=Neobacillus sp. NPDC097160 TaxID=3364298 RepID=UPI0037F18D7D
MKTKTQKKLVAIYARKSRLKDEKALEIDRQVELLTDYAEKNNMDYEVYRERGSSEDWNRPDLQRMLTDLKSKGIFDGVLVTDQDRIARDRTDFGLFRRVLVNEGLQFITLDKAYNFFNDDDMFVTGIRAELDEQIMRITKRKLRRGRIQAIKTGIWFGIAPYGYDKEAATKKLVPNAKETEIVKSIFDMYVNQGMNQAEVCEQLTLYGHMTRKQGKKDSRPFTGRATSLILSNVAYRGIVHYELEGEEPIHVIDAHEALIDEDTFNKAQVLLAQNRKVPQSQQRGIYALSRLLICPKCGQTLSFCMKYNKRSARNSLNKDERELYVLNCYSSKSSKGKRETEVRCSNNGVKASRVEDAIFMKLRAQLVKIDEEIEAVLSGANTFISSVETKQQELSNRYSSLEEQKKRVQNGHKIGIYSDDEAMNEIKAIREQQLAVSQELKNLEGASVKAEVDRKKQTKLKIERLLSMDTTDPVKTNKLLHEVIDKVYYWKEQNDSNGEKPFEILIEFKR